MVVKKLVLLLLVIKLVSCSSPTQKMFSAEERNFYNFAYTICVGSAFEDLAVKGDAGRSANGYIQFGNIELDAYQELRERVNFWLAKEYKSKQGGSLQLMKCNDFYHSGEIQEIYLRYDPCKNKSS